MDNADDVDRLEATVRDGDTQDVLVRIIPGVTADTHSHVLTGHEGSKFGLSPRDAAPLIRRIEHSQRLRMRGLHVHVGSQILDVEPFAESVAPVAALGEFPVYDLGGGLGARYTWADDPPPVGGLPRRPDRRGAASTCPPEAEVIIEPGRSMVAASAATIYRVTTVKRGVITFVAVDGGMGDNLEVALFDQRFETGDRRPVRRSGHGDGHRRRAALRERRRARRRRRAVRGLWSVTCSPYRPPARTASRWPTTTTETAGSRSSSRATARRGWSSAARRGTT